MDGIPARAASPAREGLRLLPLVPFVALVSLGACTGNASLEGTGSLIAARPELRSLGLSAAVAFGTGSVAVAAMFAVDTYRARKGGALRLSPRAVVLIGVGLFAFGLIAFIVGEEESYGRLPDGSGYAVLVVYVLGSQLLFAAGFLGHRASPRRLDSGARVLAAAHGLMGMGWGFLLAYLSVSPPGWVT